jgi:hypothetical protein
MQVQGLMNSDPICLSLEQRSNMHTGILLTVQWYGLVQYTHSALRMEALMAGLTNVTFRVLVKMHLPTSLEHPQSQQRSLPHGPSDLQSMLNKRTHTHTHTCTTPRRIKNKKIFHMG